MRHKPNRVRKHGSTALRLRRLSSETLEPRNLLTSAVSDPVEVVPVVEDVIDLPEPESALVSFSVVSERTSLVRDEFGSRTAPVNVSETHEWDEVYVEVWVKALGSHSVSQLSIDFEYDTDLLSVIDIEFSDAFGLDQAFVINDAAGTVTGIQASTDVIDFGLNESRLFARILIDSVPALGDNVKLDHVTGSVGPYDAKLKASNVDLVLSEDSPVDLQVDLVPELNLLPVIYDLNDDQIIGLGDLSKLLLNYGKSADSIADGDAWFADFNKNYKVDLADISLFLNNFGIDHSDEDVSFASNYPEAWVPNEAVFPPVVEPPVVDLPVQAPKPVLDLDELVDFDPANPDIVLPGADIVFVLLVDNFTFPIGADLTRLSGHASLEESLSGEESYGEEVEEIDPQIILSISLEDNEIYQTEIEIIFEGDLVDTLSEWWDLQGYITEYVSQMMTSVQVMVEDILD